MTIVCGPGLDKSGCPAFSPFALFAQLAVWRVSLSGFAVHLRMISGTYTLICIVSVVVNALTYYYYYVNLQTLLTGLANARDGFDLFGRASGQRLNMGKTHLLPIGLLPDQGVLDLSPGTEFAGFTVVASATTLGVTFDRGGGGHTTISRGQPHHNTTWSPQEETRLEGVERALQSLGGMRLSLLGRGLGSGVYCTSKFFYHLEYRLPIPLNKYVRLNSAIASLMSDKHRDGRRPFYAIAKDVAAGRPKFGGLGSFPWDSHVAARHARWAARLIAAPLQVSWASLLRALLYTLCGPEAHPLLLFDLPLELRTSVPALGRLPAMLGQDNASGPWPKVPNVLARLAIGARSLGSLRRLDNTAISPIAGCGGGLELAAPLPADWSQRASLSVQHLQAVSSVVHTVGFIPHAKSKGVAILPSVGRPPRQGDGAGQAEGGARPDKREAGPSALTVRNGTQLQIMLHGDPIRRNKWGKFYLVAAGLHCDGETAGVPVAPLLGPAPGNGVARHYADPAGQQVRDLVHDEIKAMQGIFARVWCLSWSNQRKEIFWRLVYHGIPTPVRLGQLLRRCPCGALPHSPAGRPHVFWDCPIAKAIRDHITAVLPRPPHGRPHLSREHIWLFRPPQPAIHQLLWDVICLAALGAMEYGRRVLLSLAFQRDNERGGGPSQDDASEFSDFAGSERVDGPLNERRDILLRAQRASVAHFYSGLADFCNTTEMLPIDLEFLSVEARDRHPLLRLRPPRPVVVVGVPPSGPCEGSAFGVVLPPTASLPRRDDLREMSLNRVVTGPSANEILKARMVDQNSGDVIACPAVFRGGVIENMVFCVCGIGLEIW